MLAGARVFLDTSALFSGVWSVEGGARYILKLGEAGLVKVLVSSQVLTEIERALQVKVPHKLGQLALLLHESGVEVVPNPPQQTVQDSLHLIGYAADAQVFAAAWAAGVDYFVTLDRQHFLDNESLRGAVPFPIGTPGDFLAWYRNQLSE